MAAIFSFQWTTFISISTNPQLDWAWTSLAPACLTILSFSFASLLSICFAIFPYSHFVLLSYSQFLVILMFSHFVLLFYCTTVPPSHFGLLSHCNLILSCCLTVLSVCFAIVLYSHIGLLRINNLCFMLNILSRLSTNPKSKSKVQVQTDDWAFIKIRFSNHPATQPATQPANQPPSQLPGKVSKKQDRAILPK